VLNVFRMFSRMTGRRIAVESDGAVPLEAMLRQGIRARPDVSALASFDRNKLCVLVWHYHDDDVPAPTAAVTVELSGLSPQARDARLVHFRIDDQHSNAFTAWKAMGSPQRPTAEQYTQLEKAGKLTPMGHPQPVTVADGRVTIPLRLPRQSVSLLVLTW